MFCQDVIKFLFSALKVRKVETVLWFGNEASIVCFKPVLGRR